MKNYTKILFAVAFAIFACAAVTMANEYDDFDKRNAAAHRKFESTAMTYIESKDFSGLKTYIRRFPRCERKSNGKAPSTCNIDLTDGKQGFLAHVKLYITSVSSYDIINKLREEGVPIGYQKDFTIISTDAGIEHALASLFYNRFHIFLHDPLGDRKEFKQKIKQFYDEFKGDDKWFNSILKKTIIYEQENAWYNDKNGKFIRKPGLTRQQINAIFASSDAASNSTPQVEAVAEQTVEEVEPEVSIEGICEIPHVPGLNNKYKIAFKLDEPDLGRACVKNILNSMEDARVLKKLGYDGDSLANVASEWFDSLITPVQQVNVVRDADTNEPKIKDGRNGISREESYYGSQGKKQEAMYKFFNEEGWKIFAKAGVNPTTNKRLMIAIRSYIKACPRVLQDKEICYAFKDGASGAQFYVLSDQENKEFEDYFIENEIATQVEDALSGGPKKQKKEHKKKKKGQQQEDNK